MFWDRMPCWGRMTERYTKVFMRYASLAVIAALVAVPRALPQRVLLQGALLQTKQQPTGQLDANPTLFVVLAAANAAGYDAGIDSPSNNPVRQIVRDRLAKQKLTSMGPLAGAAARRSSQGSGGGAEPLHRVLDFVRRTAGIQARAVGPASSGRFGRSG